MGLKLGYKQTEIGVIPEAWNDGCLGDNTKKIGSGITPTGGERVYKQEGRPFLRSQNIGWGALRIEDIAFIDEVTHESFKGTEIQLDDVFLNISGASIGRSAVADARVVRGNVNQHVCIIRTDQDRLHPRFLNSFLLSREGQRQIDSFQAGGNRQGLNFGQIRSFRLPFPPLPEQRAIAEALNDVDALIGALEHLIAKKRDLKQAAMQQLLTGQKRLPGFEKEKRRTRTEVGVIPEDWEVSTFGELFNITAGGDVDPKRSKSYRDETHRYPIYSNALTSNGLYGYCSYADHRAGSITITARGTLGFASFRDHSYSAIGRVLVLQPKQEIAGFFFAEFINNRVKFAIESTGVPQLTAPQISTYRLPLPSLHEQTAIAEVLSDMDAEIAALERRRDKTRALKKGMMQELLTGRTRLV